MSEKGKSILTAVIITLVLLIPIGIIFTIGFFASPHSANPDLKALNRDLEYTVYYYYSPRGRQAEGFQNLSRTDTVTDANVFLSKGWAILHNVDVLAELDATVADTLAEYVKNGKRNGVDTSGYTVIDAQDGTVDAVYDDAFFAEHDLLLVDMCAEGSVNTYFYPKRLRINGDTVSLTVKYDHDNATTAGSGGQYVLITIPKGCTTANISYSRDRW